MSTISGASSQEVQGISNILQQSVNSGQFANSLRQSGAQTSACHSLEHSAYMQPCTKLALPAVTCLHGGTLAHEQDCNCLCHSGTNAAGLNVDGVTLGGSSPSGSPAAQSPPAESPGSPPAQAPAQAPAAATPSPASPQTPSASVSGNAAPSSGGGGSSGLSLGAIIGIVVGAVAAIVLAGEFLFDSVPLIVWAWASPDWGSAARFRLCGTLLRVTGRARCSSPTWDRHVNK